MIVTLLLVGACVLLYLDGRGKRKALAEIQSTLTVALKRLTAQDEQIGFLTRALAILVPAEARPTGAHYPVGLSRPFKPSAEQVREFPRKSGPDSSER